MNFMTCTASPSNFSESQDPVMNEHQSYSEDGIDLTLIRLMLSLTPSERHQVLQQNVQSLKRLINETSFTRQTCEEKEELRENES
jgi:hypothetical protein